MTLTMQQYIEIATTPKTLHKRVLERAGEIKKAELKQCNFGTIVVLVDGEQVLITKDPHQAIEMYNSLTF